MRYRSRKGLAKTPMLKEREEGERRVGHPQTGQSGQRPEARHRSIGASVRGPECLLHSSSTGTSGRGRQDGLYNSGQIRRYNVRSTAVHVPKLLLLLSIVWGLFGKYIARLEPMHESVEIKAQRQAWGGWGSGGAHPAFRAPIMSHKCAATNHLSPRSESLPGLGGLACSSHA